MKRLSLLAVTGAFLLGVAALPSTANAGGRHHHDCCNKNCLTRVVVQNAGPADLYRAIYLSNCLKCWYPYD
jgi:hypothetical protein